MYKIVGRLMAANSMAFNGTLHALPAPTFPLLSHNRRHVARAAVSRGIISIAFEICAVRLYLIYLILLSAWAHRGVLPNR